MRRSANVQVFVERATVVTVRYPLLLVTGVSLSY